MREQLCEALGLPPGTAELALIEEVRDLVMRRGLEDIVSSRLLLRDELDAIRLILDEVGPANDVSPQSARLWHLVTAITDQLDTLEAPAGRTLEARLHGLALEVLPARRRASGDAPANLREPCAELAKAIGMPELEGEGMASVLSGVLVQVEAVRRDLQLVVPAETFPAGGQLAGLSGAAAQQVERLRRSANDSHVAFTKIVLIAWDARREQ